MKRPTTMILAALTASLFATAGYAESGGVQQDEHYVERDKFRELDKDKDGRLTKGETSQIRDYGPAFDKADANKDGKLTLEEFTQAESIHNGQMAKAYMSDAAITAKVKTALFREPDLKATAVGVETDKGRVQLSGWVDSEAQRKKAITATSKVEGVKAVKDGMNVR